jgi:hypothetical protein
VASDGDIPQYRIKCTTENFERIVWESELERAAMSEKT